MSSGSVIGVQTNYDYVYDDENRLVQWFYYQHGLNNVTSGDQRTDFVYDGLGRLRKRIEYTLNVQTNNNNFSFSLLGATGSTWVWTNEVRYSFTFSTAGW